MTVWMTSILSVSILQLCVQLLNHQGNGLHRNMVGVAKNDKNLPGIPHCDWLDFFIVLIILDSSIGLVLIWDRSDATSN